MIQAWMIIQFRNRMHRNGVNLAEKKLSFSKFIMEKIPVCNLALLDFHQNISNFLGCNVKTGFFFLHQLIFSYLDYQKNSVKMQNHGTKNLSNRKLKIHWIVYQIIFHRKKKSSNQRTYFVTFRDDQNFVKNSYDFTTKNCIVIRQKKCMYLQFFVFVNSLIKNFNNFTTKSSKIHTFWEGLKILRNLHLTFDWHYIGQN